MNTPIIRIIGATLVSAALLSTTVAAQEQDRSDWPRSFTLGTAGQGGTYYIYGSGWTDLLSKELGLSGSAEVTGGPTQNVTLVQTGDFEFGMVTLGPAKEALEGNSPLAPGMQHDQVRAMFPMYQTPFSCITLKGSGIASVTDMKDGTVVGVGPAGGTSDQYFPQFFEELGIKIAKSNASASDLGTQLQDGLIQALCFAAGIPISAFSELEAQADVNIFGFTDEQINTLVEKFPVNEFTIPADTYRSIDEDMDTIAMWNFMVTHADMPENLVYELVKLTMENQERLLNVHGAAEETVPENVDKNTLIPYHPGAVRWFEENGHDIPDDLEG